MGPAQSVLGPECVRKVRHIPRGEGHYVEAHLDCGTLIQFEELTSRLDDSPLLRPIDGLLGMGLRSPPHLHFHEHHRPAVHSDEVDLPMLGLKPAGNNRVSEGFQVGGGPIFGPSAYASKIRQGCSSFLKGRNDIR